MVKNNILKWIIAIVAVIIAYTAGFVTGKQGEVTKYQAERELNIQLNRSELNIFDGVEGTIYVTGHKSPDSDTVGSSIGYAALLQKLGYDAVPVVLGKINDETKYVLETGGIDVPMLLEDASDCNMVLVDHSEYTQSADGLQNANIIAIIDHHNNGSVTTGNQLIYDAKPLGSTATIIWMLYRNYGVEIDENTAYAMVGSILSDTNNLQSNTTTFADKEALRELSKLAGIKDTDAMYREMYRASISYTDMTDTEIFFSDYKEYENGGKKYGIGCINAYDEEGAKDLIERMKNILTSDTRLSELDMAFAQISIFHDDISVTYLVPSNKTASEVLKTAFGDKSVYDGTSYKLEPGISRKKVLVPAITDVLE